MLSSSCHSTIAYKTSKLILSDDKNIILLKAVKIAAFLLWDIVVVKT